MTGPSPVPAEVTAAVVSAFLQPYTTRQWVRGTASPRQYEEVLHVPSGADATIVTETAADGAPSMRSLTFEEVLAVAYPVIAGHVREHPDLADQAISPTVTGYRSGIRAVLDDLGAKAAADDDPALAFAAGALRAVHDLFDGADTVGARGTWQAEARVQVHNAIVDAFARWTDLGDDDAWEFTPPPGGPRP